MGETISCLSDETNDNNNNKDDDIIDFTIPNYNSNSNLNRKHYNLNKEEENEDELNFSLDLTSCITAIDNLDDNINIINNNNDNDYSLYNIDKNDFIELSQEDLPIGVSAIDIDEKLNILSTKKKSFYQVPPNLDKPVGLRRYPHKNSQRTGDIINPGEVIETIQEITIDGIKYLRTIGGSTCSGWLFERHPTLNTVMLEYIPGELNETKKSYMYKIEQTNPIGILTGPNENCQKTNHAIFPGEEIDICETWKPCDGEGKTYVKLSDGRGWVELNHPVSNEEMFCEII